MTARPMTEEERRERKAIEAAEHIIAIGGTGLMPKERDRTLLVARALLSTSAAVRGMREALEKEEKAHGETISERDSLEAFIAELYHDATGSECIWSNNFGLLEVRDAIIAALSLIEGEDEQARPSGSASISTDTKGTTK